MDNQIKVIIRFKSIVNVDEECSPNWIIDDEAITYKNTKQDEIFEFDVIMPPETEQQEIFNALMLPKISFFLQGYNSAVFAYGATSSGKTYTILGPESTMESIMNNKFIIDSSSGILPRSFYQIIDGYQKIKEQEQLQSVSLKSTYVEIYNEQIYDLLNQQYKTNNQKVDLKISSIADGPKLMGVREVSVDSVNDLMELVAFGNYNRAIGATQFNSRSSRSHVIFTIELIVEWKDKSIRTSKIQFIDLAGSERLAKSVAKGQVLEETKKINQSLHCLGHCIMALSSRKNKHVPYRDSKLTLYLKECLGGNSNTSFICAVSSEAEHEEKTVQTLKFAQRAKLILNKVKLNIKLSYEQIEKQMSMLKQELSIMEKVLLMNGIKYDKQFFKEQNFQLHSEQPMNIEELTGEYRRSIKRSLQQSSSKSDVKEQFTHKFQLYLESESQKPKQHSSPQSKLVSRGSTQNNMAAMRKKSLPCSLEGSEEEDTGDRYLNEAQILQALKSISETPRDLQQFMADSNNQMRCLNKDSQYFSTSTNPTMTLELTKPPPPKKRDTCCTVF